jgi:hypothetical protein
VFGGGAIATAVGVWQRRQWGRILTLVAAGFLAVIGIFSGFFMSLMPMPPNVPEPNIWAGVRMSTVIVFLCMAVLGVSWIVVFTRPKMRHQFAQAAQARGEVVVVSSRPLSILVIGWFFAVSGVLGTCMQLFIHSPSVLFATVMTGVSATLFQVVWGLVAIAMGWGLLKTRKWAWSLAVTVQLFAALNGAVFVALPGRDARIRLLMKTTRYAHNGDAQIPLTMMPLMQVVTLVLVVGIPLYFLISRRKRYMAVAQ